MNDSRLAPYLNSQGLLDATQFRSLLDGWQPPGRQGLFAIDSPSAPEDGLISRVRIYEEPGVVASLSTFAHALAPESCDMEDGWSRNEDFSRGDDREELLLIGNSPHAGSLKVEFLVDQHEDFVRIGDIYDELVDLFLQEVPL